MIYFSEMGKSKHLGWALALFIATLSPIVLADMPSTNSYKLNSYGFGSGGTANSTTPNYALEGITGELSGQTTSTTTYTAKPGFIETQQANVPVVTLSNPSNYYDKLKFVIDQQNNPSDAKYALQISTTSDFSSNVNYVKSDLTIGATLTLADYQTYTTWGGAGGNNIIGLSASTTYYLRAKATQGKFSESGYGPSSSAATVGQQISFCLYAGASCGSGNSVAMGSLLPGTVTTGSPNIGVDFATNADSGGFVYSYSTNGGLKSVSAGNYLIASSSADLDSAGEGFGAQVSSSGQTSGGPFVGTSAYLNGGNIVGALATTISTVLGSSNAPVVGGTATVPLKAVAAATTRAASDYGDTLTFIAAAAF
jgi:hypothetical protein